MRHKLQLQQRCTSQRDLQPIGRRLSPGLQFNGLHPRNPCSYMDYYSFTDPEGMEG